MVLDVPLPEYLRLIGELKATGFKECRDEGAPVCRYERGSGDERLLLDVMQAEGNRWYVSAIESAEQVELAPNQMVRVIAPIYFIATKLEAFRDRGRGDYLGSHDLEDIITVLEALPELRHQISQQASDVAEFLRNELSALSRLDRFRDAVMYTFPAAPERARALLDSLEAFGGR